MGIAPLELTGLATDLPPYRYPPNVWTFGQNIQMADGFPKRADGFGAVFDAPLHLSRFHVNVQQESQSTWVYCGDTLISTYDGAHTDITGTEVFDSTGLESPWSGGILNRHAILNNQTNVPLSWRVGSFPFRFRRPAVGPQAISRSNGRSSVSSSTSLPS